MSVETGFVSGSAKFSFVLMYCTLMSLVFSFSLMKKYRIAMCFVMGVWPSLSADLMVATLSMKMVGGFLIK